jgi:putative transposase
VRELAHARVRFGYRRIYMLLRREGWDVGMDRFYRVYREENLGLRRKRPWRHVTAVHRAMKQPAGRPNEVGAWILCTTNYLMGARSER